MSTRREFLKTSCGICAALSGIGMAAAFLEGCATVPMIKASPVNNTLSVPLSSFAKSAYVLVRSSKLESDILLVKKSDNTFTGLLMQCTHEAQPLSISGNGLHCAAHGSSFDLDGNVTHSPATRPLTKYIAAQQNDNVIIQLKNQQ